MISIAHWLFLLTIFIFFKFVYTFRCFDWSWGYNIVVGIMVPWVDWPYLLNSLRPFAVLYRRAMGIGFHALWCWVRLRSFAGHLGLALVFAWGGALRGGAWFLFFGGFLLVLAGLLSWRGGWGLGYRSWGLSTCVIFSDFLRS